MLAVADFIPALELPSHSGYVPLRPREDKATVIVTVHGPRCAECRDYLLGLAALKQDFWVWDARLLVVTPEPGVQIPFGTVLTDQQQELPETGSASVLICDRYGQIFEAFHAGDSHGLPVPSDITETLKFIGTLCPE